VSNQKDLFIMAKRTAESAATRSVKPDESAPPGSGRIIAIDALRGFDMFWIVGGRELVLAFVGIFKNPVPQWLEHQLEHVRWTGSTVWDSFTAWDLIMPLFLFVVGAAMPFSFARRLEQGQSKAQLYAKIIRRTVILFVLGMAVQGHLLDFKFDTLHVFANTLQAIAVGYLIAGLVMLNLGIIGQILFTTAMLVGYCLLLMYVPLTGHGTGSLEEHANVALAVDKFILGDFIDDTNPPYTWVLSGMTFAASVLLGVFSGHILRSRLTPWGRTAVLTVIGIACLGGGWAWAELLGFPIIKHIWTSSMVLWAAGWSYLLVALFYLVIDIAGLRRWAFPFIVIGMNAIVIYVAWHFIPFTGIAKDVFGGLAAHLGSVGPFVVALSAVLLWWLVLYDLYRRKIYLRL
jgi:predicted acyltransferase